MELLVEVKLLEEFLLITCNSNMTVSQMSLVALSEYDTAHLNNTPKNVQHVKVRTALMFEIISRLFTTTNNAIVM
jgi:hypothetical protein